MKSVNGEKIFSREFPSPMGNEVGLIIKELFKTVIIGGVFPSPMGNEVGLIENYIDIRKPILCKFPSPMGNEVGLIVTNYIYGTYAV